MAQRLSRARATLRAAGARFELPSARALPERVAAVLDVLYLAFNEGYTRSAGDTLVDGALTAEAIRLTRDLRRRLPDHDEVAGALALMLLTRAREAARTDARGDLVPLAEQDRALWDAWLIAEGVEVLERVLPRGPVGRFQLQAAIAAVHAEAAVFQDTDWPQIAALYEMLEQVAPGPAVTLNRAVAVGMTDGPERGLTLVDALLEDPAMRRHHRTHAVRAHLLEMAGEREPARQAYLHAARLTASLPEQRYLNARAARLS
jgi:predicted RNA polymerase sigma factor